MNKFRIVNVSEDKTRTVKVNQKFAVKLSKVNQNTSKNA